MLNNPGDVSGLAKLAVQSGLSNRVTEAILKLISVVPKSSEHESSTPDVRARLLARTAARTSAGISGGAALVPGPLGILSLLPDIVGVWRVQAQMVSDIAATYGKTATLTKEHMVYCLFKHTASQLLRDVVMRSGERFLVRPVSLRMMQSLVAKINIKVGQRAIGKTVARYAPVIGAIGVGGYAYYDTNKVAKTAIELFSKEVVVVVDSSSSADQG
jgi:hypothetical protein